MNLKSEGVRKLSFGILVLIALVLFFRGPRKLLYSVSSPDAKYKVEVTQERPFPYIERAVYLNAYRDRTATVKRKLLYTGDFMDDDFRDLYPNPRFSSNSLFELGEYPADHERIADLTISNDTPEVISYLLVETGRDKYVYLDVGPKTQIRTRFQFRGSLSCQGAYETSKKRFGAAAQPAKYRGENGDISITIKRDSVLIESPQLMLRPDRCCASDRPDFDHEQSY